MKKVVEKQVFKKLDWSVCVLQDHAEKLFIIKVAQKRENKTMVFKGDEETKNWILFSIDTLERSYKESI
jgi:hypothetical protein